jgi:glyoxylase-like metal-dependent hydrolase (beta-lactamase superfamily II)
MKSFLSRRRFLLSSAGGVLATAALTPGVAFTKAARMRVAAQELGNGLLWIQGAGANLVVLKCPEGLVFADGGLATHAGDVLALAQKQLREKRVAALLNTHWHREHTGLNERLGGQGVRILAHENTRLWLSTTVRYEPDGPPFQPLAKQARPNVTTWRDGDLQAGDEIIRYGYLSQAHTDGDLYVHFTKADVLVTGGVVAGNGWPTADWVTGGWINGTVAGYQTLIGRCTDQTRVVSAYGDRLMTRADLQAEQQILAKLAGELGKMMRSGYGPADVLAANPAKDFVEKLGDPTEFLTQSFRGMWPRMAPDA